ncbi:MAG: hypothetical protein KC649_07140, partial [Candidatus Omnitrophica bacterium]|nr:hypothetical protein [Candidatus Omnitrophota bacterium]
ILLDALVRATDNWKGQPKVYAAFITPVGDNAPGPDGVVWKGNKVSAEMRHEMSEILASVFSPLIQVSKISLRNPDAFGTDNALKLIDYIKVPQDSRIHFVVASGSDTFSRWHQNILGLIKKHHALNLELPVEYGWIVLNDINQPSDFDSAEDETTQIDWVYDRFSLNIRSTKIRNGESQIIFSDLLDYLRTHGFYGYTKPEPGARLSNEAKEAEDDVAALYTGSDLQTLQRARSEADDQLRKVTGNREFEAYWSAYRSALDRLIAAQSNSSSSGARLTYDEDPLKLFAGLLTQSNTVVSWKGKVQSDIEVELKADVSGSFRNVPAARNRIRLIVNPTDAWKSRQTGAGAKALEWIQSPRNRFKFERKLASPLTAPAGSFGQIILDYSESLELISETGERIQLGPTLLADAIQNRIGFDDIDKSLWHDLDLWRDNALNLVDQLAAQKGLNLVVRHPATIRSAKLVPDKQMVRNYFR